MSGVALLAGLLSGDRPEAAAHPATRSAAGGQGFGSVLAQHLPSKDAQDGSSVSSRPSQRATRPTAPTREADATRHTHPRAHGRSERAAKDQAARSTAGHGAVAQEAGAQSAAGAVGVLSQAAVAAEPESAMGTVSSAGSAQTAPLGDKSTDSRADAKTSVGSSTAQPIGQAGASGAVAQPGQPDRPVTHAPQPSPSDTSAPPAPRPAGPVAGGAPGRAVRRPEAQVPTVGHGDLPGDAATAASAAAAATPTPGAATAAPASSVGAAAVPATLPAPQPELEAALTRLRTRPAGAHELTVQLHPADLGAVRVVATLSGDRLDVTVLCADHAAQQAVAAAVPALHDRLSELSHIDIRGTAHMNPGVPRTDATRTNLGPSHQPPGSFGDGSHRPPQGGSERHPATLPTGPAEASTADHAPPSRPNRRNAGVDGRFDRRI